MALDCMDVVAMLVRKSDREKGNDLRKTVREKCLSLGRRVCNEDVGGGGCEIVKWM